MQVIAVEVTIAEKKWRVQHPGNRKNLELQGKAINPRSGEMKQEVIFDYMFEHCIEPLEGQPAASLDTLHPAEVEEWAVFLPTFLRGKDVSRWLSARPEKPAESGEPTPVSHPGEEGGATRV